MSTASSVAQTTDAFGCSRPTFYQAQTAFKAQGLPGLVPRKRGPRGAHKLDDAVMAFVHALTHRRSRRSARRRCSATFGGALASPSTGAPSSAPSGARKKNGAERPGGRRGGVPPSVLVTSYEMLRRVALGHSGPARRSQSRLHAPAPPGHDGLAARVGDVSLPRRARASRRLGRPRFRRSCTTSWRRSGRTWCCCIRRSHGPNR